MPTYLFLDTETNDEIEEFMFIRELEQYLIDNPTYIHLMNGAPAIGDHIRLGLRKPDDSFRDLLRNTKKKHSQGITKSTVNTF